MSDFAAKENSTNPPVPGLCSCRESGAFAHFKILFPWWLCFAFLMGGWVQRVAADPHHIRFPAVPWVTDTNTGVGLLLRAENADGTLETNFNQSLTIVAEALEGTLPLEPTNTGNFFQGQVYVSFRVAAPGHAVRLRALEFPGQTDPFTVVPPAFYTTTQTVADIVWHESSQTLLASVPKNAASYSNCIVAIDPETGQVTNAYPVGFDPGQMEISPGGFFLYVTLSNRAALQRFDLTTRTAGLKFALGTNSDPVRTAFDFCVAPGFSDSVVVETRDNSGGNSSRAGIWRYGSGVPTLLSGFDGAGWMLEGLTTANDVILSPTLQRGNALSGAILATAANFGGTRVTYRSPNLYDDHGNFYSTTDLRMLGTYPNVLDQPYHTALPEVNPVHRRVFFMAGYANFGTTFYKLRIYDRDLLQPLGGLAVPGTPGGPSRFLALGTNRLAYATGDGQLWFVRPEAVQPADPPADVAVSISGLPPFAVVGTNYSFTLSLSNAGPGIASIVQVTNALPPNVTIIQTLPTSGSTTTNSSSFVWNVTALTPGSNVTMQVTLRFNTAGWQTNTTYALGFEADPVFTNNSVTLPLYVQLAPGAPGVFDLNYSSEDLLYDPVRDRLLLSVAMGAGNQTNGIAVFNPHSGVIETFTPLGKQPSKLARSDNGQYLYVSLPADALVRQLNLVPLTQVREFALGGEDIYGVWYPFYAADMAVVPGAPDSLAAWRVRRPGPMADGYGWGIGLFDSGVMRSNVTASGGNWRVEFDTATGTLFGFSVGDFRRCTIDSNGVSFVQSYSIPSAGDDIEYGAGHFFTTDDRLVETQPFKLAWVFPGAEGGKLVEPDAANGRVYYLVQNNGWSIQVYDIASHLRLGSMAVPNLAGTPTSLIRWGTNGLAFRTTANQIYVVRTPLVQLTDAAEVKLNLTGPPTAPIGSNAVFTLTVTNQGPAVAANLRITNTFSSPVSVISLSGSTGAWATNGGVVSWTVPSLAAGTQATLNFTIASAPAGVLTLIGSATADTPDPLLSDNTDVQLLLGGAPLALNSSMRLQIPVNDLVWSPSLGRLLATSSTNTPNWSGAFLSVDPVGLEVRCETVLGADAGRMAISRTDGMVYAGVDLGVGALTLPGLVSTQLFLANIGGPVYDLDVVPGADQSVVVGSRSLANNSSWLGTYDNGTARTNVAAFFTTGMAIEFGNNPALFYCQQFNSSGFQRFTNNAQGVSLIDSDTSILPTGTALDLKWDGSSRLYSSVGNVIYTPTRTLAGTIAGITPTSKVCYDPASSRVFFLSPGGLLRAFDGPSLLPVGTAAVPGVGGSLGSFVRWGLDGFAVTTGAGQIVIFRSSLIPTNPPADVSVTLTHSQPPFIVGSNIVATIVITNSGPNPATDVNWNNALPVGTVVLNATSSTGSCVVASNTVSGSLSVLPVGGVVNVSVQFAPAAAGVISNAVTASASSLDPGFTNNFAAALLWVQPSTGLPAMTTLSLPVKDLEHDPIRPLLYASFGPSAGLLADSVVSIDPVNGNISAPQRVGSNPGRLAASPDGQFLYVALDGAGAVQKLTLPGLVPVSSFPVPQSQVVQRMVVSPADPEMVAIRRASGKTSLHVGGVARPGELTDQDLFAFSESSGALFGCDGPHSNVKMYRLNTAANGLTLLDSQPGKQSSAVDLKSSGGLLFFDRGMVLNPDTKEIKAVMPVPFNSVVEPDTGSGRAFYLTVAGSAWTLRAFDIVQGIEIGSLPVPGLLSAPRRLVRWGADGLALYTTNSQVVILRGLLVPTNPPIDLALRQTVNVTSATTNDTLSVSLLLTNSGPAIASGVVVTQLFSLPVTNVALTPGAGAASYTNGALTWSPGNIPSGGTASLTATLRATQTGTLNFSAAAYHSLNDAFWGNNAAINAVNILSVATSNLLQIRLATREIVYDPSRDLIYATTPATNRLFGNLIAVLNPLDGTMDRSLPAGSEPEQLALSDTSQWLYASLNGAMGVRRFDLQSGATGGFSLGTNDIYNAQDLEVQPGHPETVAASLNSLNFASGFPSDVWIYDNGIPRPTKGGTARGLTFSSTGPQLLFGYFSPGSSFGFMRMRLGPMGIVANEGVSAFTSIPGDLKFNNGRLYSISGQVADPYAGILIGRFGSSGPLAVDTDVGRGFYLAQSGTNWEIRGFDLGTLQPTSTQTVVGVQGTPAGLIRCGGNRLAFRTSAGQVFVVRSSLVPTNSVPPCDLGVSQQAAQDFDASAETLRFQITVTNRGPGAASNVVLAIKSPIAPSVALELSQGTATNVSGNFLCTLGSLAAGQSLRATVTAVITNTGSYTNFVSVSAPAIDPDLSDNTSSATVNGLFFQRPNTTKVYSANTQGLAYDPVRRRLFAALTPVGSTNRLAWFDPESGAMLGTMPIGINATRLVVTDDGQFMYLSSSTTGLVQRVHLPSLTVDLNFTPPSATIIRATSVIPGNPHALAAAYVASGTVVNAVFDDGVARPNKVPDVFCTLLACSIDGTALYGYANTGTGIPSPDVFRMTISASGLQLLDTGPDDVPWGNKLYMLFGYDRLLYENGAVLNPATWTEDTYFSLPYGGASIDLIPPINGVGFLTGDSISYSVSHVFLYAMAGRQQLTQIDVQLTGLGVDNLTYCGADRLAYRSPSEIVFIRSGVIPSCDLVLRASPVTNQVMVGDSFPLVLTVSNSGPNSVSGSWLTNVVPVGIQIVSATVSQGTLTTNGQVIIANLGPLTSSNTATLNLTLKPSAAAVGISTNSAEVLGSGQPDPILANNRIDRVLTIVPLDSDHDGMPDDWEITHHLNPTNSVDANIDSDCDGKSNLQEYQAGTDPLVFDDLRILSLQRTSAALEFTVKGAIGKTYVLESSADLQQWSAEMTFVCRESNQHLTLPWTNGVPGRFYRLRSTTDAALPVLTLVHGPASPSGALLQVTAPPGHTYWVQVSSNLVDWSNLTNYFGLSCETLVSDSIAGPGPRFYRVFAP
jgi:uncharacterized repeat protein (TIGR01451 family)